MTDHFPIGTTASGTGGRHSLFCLQKKTTAILLAPNPHVAKPAAVQSNRESAIQNILPTV